VPRVGWLFFVRVIALRTQSLRDHERRARLERRWCEKRGARSRHRPTPAAIEASPPEPELCAGAILRRDHERLEKIYEDLLASYRSDEWEQVRTQWEVFEPALRAHMDTEEHDIFPELRTVDRTEADALLAQHAELRRLLATLGVAIDFHAVPARDAQELIAQLRAHGAREEKLLYPWMDRALDPRKLRRLSPAGSTAAATD
jgi:hemerythrin-like domain-containing protein